MAGLGKNIGDAYIEVHSDTGPFRRELRREARAAGAEAGDEFDRSLGSRLGRLDIGLRRLRGSRNDFLNIIGVMAGGLERLFGESIRSGFERVGSVIAGFGRTLAQTNGPLTAVGNALDKFGLAIGRLGGGGIDGLIIQIGAFVIGLQALLSIAGPVAAGLSGLFAAVTALAVGLGGALLGGVVALGPALAALGGGVGALVVAFSDLSKQQKAAFTPLKDLLDEVRGSVQEALFKNAGSQIKELAAALRPLGGLLTALAGEFSEWADDVLKAVGPNGRVNQSLQTLGKSIPGLFRTLLDLISNLSAGFTGLFAGAAPGAQRLFDGFNRAAAAFAEWSNSVAGQTAINDFMNTAIDLLGDIWDLAKQVGSTLSNLWEMGGAEAARTIIQDIANAFRDLNAYMESPAGRQAVLDFFQNGINVLRTIGPFLQAVIDLFRSLDTEFNRTAFQKVVDGLTSIVGGLQILGTVAQAVLINFTTFVNGVKNVANSLGNLQQKSAQAGQAFRKNITDAFNKVSNGVKPVIDKILSLRSPMDSAGQAGQRLRERISTAVQGLNLAVIKAIGSAIRQFQNLSTRAASAANAAVGSLRNLASQANSALSRFASSIQQGIQRAVTFFGQLPGRAVSALQGLNSSLYTAGVNAIQGLYNGIVSKAGSVISYVSNLAGQVAGAFRRALGIASPSKLFAEYGGNIVEGLIRGLESQEKSAVKSGDDLAKGVIQGAQTSLERASASLKQTAQLVTSRLASAGPNPKLNKAFKTQGEAAIRALTNGLDDGREAAQAEVKTIVERISAVATKAMKGQDAKTKKALQNQAKSLQQWVKGQGAALDAVWREVDRARTRLDTARGKLKELQDQFSQLSSSFRDQLRGEIDLGSAIQSDGTATFDQVAANVSGLAAKMKTFAGLLKKLIAEGLPPALVQEVASLGTEKGIAIARALLSGTDAQRSSLVSDFKSIQSSTASIGNLLADQMYGAGIEAQKGLIKGLEANEKALVAAAKKIAQRITNEVKKELGIKSPSKVFQEIGLNITQGLANGIDQGQRVVDQSMRRLVPTDALNNLNAPLSSLAAQGAGGGSLRGGGTTIAEGAIQIVTPFANPRLVAQEFMDALAARGK